MAENNSFDWMRIKYDNPVVPGKDEFTFRTYAPVINDETLEQDVFKNKIRAVPNPYYGYSVYESGSERRIMFSPLPEKCTIRVFSLSGTLIRTLKKDDLFSYFYWDLTNDYGMQITGGVYIYIVESEKLGRTTGKMAVFIDER